MLHIFRPFLGRLPSETCAILYSHFLGGAFMPEKEHHNRFWRTIAEKTVGIQMESNKLSNANKRL